MPEPSRQRDRQTAGASSKTFKPTAGGGGSVALDDLTDVSLSSPSNGQHLEYNGSNWVNATPSGGGLADVVDDTTPQLGGDLDVNGQSIVSASSGDIVILPNSTGKVYVNTMTFDDVAGVLPTIANVGQIKFIGTGTPIIDGSTANTLTLTAVNTSGDGTIHVQNSGTGLATILQVSESSSTKSQIKVNTVTGIITNADVTLTPNGTGEVVINSLEKRHRTRRIPFRIGYPGAGDYVCVYVGGFDGDGTITDYADIITFMAVTKGTSATCKFNVHIRDDDACEGGGTKDVDVFSATNEPNATTTRATWDSGDTGWTAANTIIDSLEAVVIEVISTTNSPTSLEGWIEILPAD